MSIYVFLGPTMPVTQAQAILAATYLPPVQMGDIYRLLQRKPQVIAIIDGLFQRVPSVWHKELLFALSQGVHVYGSSSMGALRAAELHDFGMIGVGQVFQDYRDGRIEDDDEVAVIHGPAEFGYRPLSEPMVNLRAGLQQAMEEGLISTAEQQALCEAAKSLFYPERCWRAIFAAGQALGMPNDTLDALAAFVRRTTPDIKRADAVALLERIAREHHGERKAHRATFVFEQSYFWQQLVARYPFQDYNPATQHASPLVPASAVRQPDGEALRTEGDHCYRAGHYAAAERAYLQALTAAEQATPPNEQLLTDILNGLGIVYKYLARYDEAERCYRRALAILEPRLGASHPELASLYHNLGGVEHARGRYALGEPFAQRAVALRTQALGAAHPAVAADQVALAALLDGQGKYAEAEQLYHAAIACYEHAFGPEYWEIAFSCNNLAAIAYTRGDFSAAEQLYLRALAIKQQHLGLEHPDVGVTLNNLAVLYRSQGRDDEAASLYRRALAIFESAFGPDHPNVAICRENYLQHQRQVEAECAGGFAS